MPDPDAPRSSHSPHRHFARSPHRPGRGVAIIVLLKLLALAAVILLFWVLRVEVGIGVAVLVLLLLDVAAVLLVWAVRAGLLGRRSG